MVRTREGTLRYTINGEDQGLACENIPPNVHAVVDLYGQCAQVSIVHAAPLSHPSAPGTLAMGQTAAAAATAENSQVSSVESILTLTNRELIQFGISGDDRFC